MIPKTISSILPFIVVAAAHAQSICARVTIQLEQEAVILRDAFRATLVINNNSGEFLTDLAVNLEIIDEYDLDGTILFAGYDTPELININGALDGSGMIDPDESGTAVWTLIPTDDAAPDEPIVYGFGGTLSYATSQGFVTAPLDPVYLTVHPNPKLRVKYFLERDVYGDDPLTIDEVEPVIPFTLGLQMQNVGAGPANSVEITSSQPEITRNDRGLLIDFTIIGAQVENQPASPNLTVDLGDIQPDTSRTARWLMTSRFSGHFERFEASYEHISEFGDPRLSLIEGDPETYFLIHAVRIQEPGADAVPDFLTDDFDWPDDPFEEDPAVSDPDPTRVAVPDTIHLSSGDVETVTPVLDAVATANDDRTVTITIEDPPVGWFYVRTNDPLAGAATLAAATRDDDRQLALPFNAWRTDRVFPDDGDEHVRLDQLHIFDRIDRAGPVSYALDFDESGVSPILTRWALLADHAAINAAAIPQETQSGPISESRTGGVRALRVEFDRPILATTFTPESVRIAGLDAAGSPVDIDIAARTTETTWDRRAGVVRFDPPLPDAARYCITLNAVTGPFGAPVNDNTQLIVLALAGDVTADGVVNAADVTLAQLLATNEIDPSRAAEVRADVNRDGAVNAADASIIQSLIGRDIGAIPDPCGQLADDTPTDPPASFTEPFADKTPGIRPSSPAPKRPTLTAAAPSSQAASAPEIRPNAETERTKDGAARAADVWRRTVAAMPMPAPDMHPAPDLIALRTITDDAPEWIVSRLDDVTDLDALLATAAANGVHVSPVLLTRDGRRHVIDAAIDLDALPGDVPDILTQASILVWSAAAEDDLTRRQRVALAPGDARDTLTLATRLRSDPRVNGATPVTLDLPGNLADVDGDGAIEIADLQSALEAIARGDASADLNGDGAADIADVVLIINAMGEASRMNESDVH